MSNRFRVSRPLILQTTLVLGILCDVTVHAQRGVGPAPAGAPGDPAVARGRTLFVQSCGFCHGADARGGAEGGSDLTASPIVMADQSGSTLDPFLRVGRPERKMPPFTLLNLMRAPPLPILPLKDPPRCRPLDSGTPKSLEMRPCTVLAFSSALLLSGMDSEILPFTVWSQIEGVP